MRVVLKRTVGEPYARASLTVSNRLAFARGLLGLLGQKNSLDVGQDTTLSDGDTGQQLVQFLVVADGQLQVTGDDSGLLVVTGGVACQLKDLSSQVLKHGCQVNGSASTHTLGVVALPQKTVDTANGELKTGTR